MRTGGHHRIRQVSRSAREAPVLTNNSPTDEWKGRLTVDRGQMNVKSEAYPPGASARRGLVDDLALDQDRGDEHPQGLSREYSMMVG